MIAVAIYNLNYGKLESLLDRSFSPGTEHAIIEAIKSAGIVTPSSGKIGVDVETRAAHTPCRKTLRFFWTPARTTHHDQDHGADLIAAGDGASQITDTGPGGDTLVGGAGAESLKVTHGENVLIAGSGANTLVGGAGNDTLIGGGFSLAGSGLRRLNADRRSCRSPGVDERSGDQGRGYGFADRGDRNFGGFGQGQDHGYGSHGSGLSGSGPTPSDTLMGGQGNDLLQVSHGDNLLIAGSGHDTISGGDGQDTIFGGGHDTINLNYGNEFVQGGSGSDFVNIGLHGNDVIYGGARPLFKPTRRLPRSRATSMFTE